MDDEKELDDEEIFPLDGEDMEIPPPGVEDFGLEDPEDEYH